MLTLKKLSKLHSDIIRCENATVVSQIFADLDAKMYSSGVYKKINVRSYSLIRKKYGVAPKRK